MSLSLRSEATRRSKVMRRLGHAIRCCMVHRRKHDSKRSQHDYDFSHRDSFVTYDAGRLRSDSVE